LIILLGYETCSSFYPSLHGCLLALSISGWYYFCVRVWFYSMRTWIDIAKNMVRIQRLPF
jgi:hypothetical protein